MLTARVLIIEDQLEVAQLIQATLLTHPQYSFETRWLDNGESGLKMALDWKPDLVLLDLGLPKMHGIAVLKKIHADLLTTKVCIISGMCGLETKLIGFQEGSDDYILKPFSSEELSARVGALLRRGKVLDELVLIHNDLCLHVPTQTVTRNERSFHLPKKEFELLHYLMQRPNQIVSRNELLEKVWRDKEIFPNTVDAHIESLRQKIDKGFTERYLKTAYGEGYYLSIS